MSDALRNEIMNNLIGLGYNKQEITNGMTEVSKRLEWANNSFCAVYSRKDQSWNNAQIINIAIDAQTNEEWLTVQYKQQITKQIQRFSKAIKPIQSDCENHEILQKIAEKLKEYTSEEMNAQTNEQKQVSLSPTSEWIHIKYRHTTKGNQ